MSNSEAVPKELETMQPESTATQTETNGCGLKSEKGHVHVPCINKESSHRFTMPEHSASWNVSSDDLEVAHNDHSREVFGLHSQTETQELKPDESNFHLQQGMQVSEPTADKKSHIDEGLVCATQVSEQISAVKKALKDKALTGKSEDFFGIERGEKNLDKNKPSTSVSYVQQKPPDALVRTRLKCDNSMVDEDEELREHWTRTLQTQTSAGEVVEEIVRVLKDQKMHDLLCPVCGSCITKRVILRKRKRSSLMPADSEPPEIIDTDRPLAYGCLACFSLFFKKGGADGDTISCLPFFFPPYPWGKIHSRKRIPDDLKDIVGRPDDYKLVGTVTVVGNDDHGRSPSEDVDLDQWNEGSVVGKLRRIVVRFFQFVGKDRQRGAPSGVRELLIPKPREPSRDSTRPSDPPSDDPQTGIGVGKPKRVPGDSDKPVDIVIAVPHSDDVEAGDGGQLAPSIPVIPRHPDPIKPVDIVIADPPSDDQQTGIGVGKPKRVPGDSDKPVDIVIAVPPSDGVEAGDGGQLAPSIPVIPRHPDPIKPVDIVIADPPSDDPQTGNGVWKSKRVPGDSDKPVDIVIAVPPSDDVEAGIGVEIATPVPVAPARTQPAEGLDILRSIVYGGLEISIASLGVTSSAAGGDAITRTVVYLGLATLLSGLVGFYHNVLNLYHYYEEHYIMAVGKTLLLHGTVALVSYILFGVISSVTYGFSFRESNNRNKKFALCCAITFVSVFLLSLGKAHVTNKLYLRTVSAYIGGGFLAAIIGYLAGDYISELLESWGV